jgi:hypothetical protein
MQTSENTAISYQDLLKENIRFRELLKRVMSEHAIEAALLQDQIKTALEQALW